MAEILKPDMKNLWASGGASTAPPTSKVQTGWTAEIPPYQWQNWWQYRVDSAIAYMFQHGIPEWDASSEYFANRSFVQNSGLLYVSLTNNSNQNPSSSPTNWRQLPSVLATASEVAAGVDATKIVTPSTLNSIFVGQVAFFPMSSAPSGWLKANGAEVSRTAYAALFARIGTTFGVGDGSTTFKLPDLRGEFLRGLDDGRGVDVSRALGSAQADALQNFSGQVGFRRLNDGNSLIGNSGVNGGFTFAAGARGPSPRLVSATDPSTLADDQLQFSAASGGARTASETRSRNVALLACIKY